ncbi:MAG: helix-turn-helix transcriptional regulator [Firmicutes bacterium]|nr:helix-turn-helix transcriptional regulator [Bacillota bacterium]
MHPSTVSRHVAQLEAAGLVRSRRAGQVKYYGLDHDRLRTVARVLERELGEPPRW